MILADPWLTLTAAAAWVASIAAFARWVIPPARRVVHLLDDFAGEEPRPGLPHGRPGVMDRLAQLDGIAVANREVAEAARVLAMQAAERGTQLQSGVDRTERKIERLTSRLEACAVCPPVPPKQHPGPVHR
jgi:hypothetical protein